MAVCEVMSHPGARLGKPLRLGQFNVDLRGQQPGQAWENVTHHVCEAQNLGTHESIRTDTDHPRHQEPIHLVFQSAHVSEEDFDRETQVAAGKALSGLHVRPFSRLRYPDRHSQLREESCPQGLIVKIEEAAGNPYHRRAWRGLERGIVISFNVDFSRRMKYAVVHGMATTNTVKLLHNLIVQGSPASFIPRVTLFKNAGAKRQILLFVLFGVRCQERETQDLYSSQGVSRKPEH